MAVPKFQQPLELVEGSMCAEHSFFCTALPLVSRQEVWYELNMQESRGSSLNQLFGIMNYTFLKPVTLTPHRTVYEAHVTFVACCLSNF